jgi:hypothetical protein
VEEKAVQAERPIQSNNKNSNGEFLFLFLFLPELRLLPKRESVDW